VHIAHLDRSATVATDELDSVFQVHKVPVIGAAPHVGAVLRGALAAAHATTPRSLLLQAQALEGRAVGLEETLKTIGADSIVVAGLPLPHGAERIGNFAPRLVLWPLAAEIASDDACGLALVARADTIGTLSPGEQSRFELNFSDKSAVTSPLDIALTLNRSATEQGLFGVGWFGRYVLVIRRFPQSGPRFERSVTHELLRSVLGDIAVAEVDGSRWRVSDFANTAQLPVNPTRVNLWRLMAHAEFMVDLRPPTAFGREAIESMLFSSPPIVPEGSAAHFHVQAANGGLWYQTPGEVLDLASALIDEPTLLERLRADGMRYASAHHEQMPDFVERLARLVLG
jgi:hypothetical protein